MKKRTRERKEYYEGTEILDGIRNFVKALVSVTL